MTPLRVLAIDDDPSALSRLEWCMQGVDSVALIGKTRSSAQALTLIDSLAPDVILLDMHMPELGSFDILDALHGDHAPEVIVVATPEPHVVQTFEVSDIDFLPKPFEQTRVREMLERARARLSVPGVALRIAELRDVLANLRTRQRPAASPYALEFWVRDRDARLRVPVEKVERIEAAGNYVRLYVGSRVHSLRATMQELQARLDPERFIRLHRGEIVRTDLIVAVRRVDYGRNVAVLAGGRELRIGRAYLANVAHALRLHASSLGSSSLNTPRR